MCFRILRTWEEKRLIEGDGNKHRETQCLSNDIIDWGAHAPPELQILQTRAKVHFWQVLVGKLIFCLLRKQENGLGSNLTIEMVHSNSSIALMSG